jgi:hypothetical protein
MPIVFEPPEPHRCSKPVASQYSYGTLWQCEECKVIFELQSSMFYEKRWSRADNQRRLKRKFNLK